MIIWIVQAIFELCAMVIAYLTNPIVVLFADEYGNLPKCLRFWQTYDNCLDVSWMIYPMRRKTPCFSCGECQGFSYEINGRTFNGKDNTVYTDIKELNNEQWFSVIYPESIKSKFKRGIYLLTCATWSLFYCKKYCKWFRFRLYIGWKLKSCTKPVDQRAMLAISINPFKPLEIGEK